MAMTSGRDDATLRRYREASAALDERPSEAARAAVLAAAARQVNARPMSADAPRPVARRRWPLAVAATVLLSTLAALVATHTEQEMPTFTAPVDRTEGKVAVAPAQRAQLEAPQAAAPAAVAEADKSTAATTPAAPRVAQAPSAPPVAQPAKPAEGRVAAEPPLTQPSNGAAGNKLSKTRAATADQDAQPRSIEETRERRDAPLPAAEPVARAKANTANEAETGSSEAQGIESKRRAFPGAASGSLQSAPSTPPPPAASAPPAVAGAAAPQSQTAGRDLQTTADSAKREQAFGERAAARNDAAPPVVQGAMRQEAAPKESAPKDYEASADTWLDYVVRLRREGRHDEADLELKRLRERYPDVRVPPAALRPTATR
jgi:hypothetical protein